MGYLNNVSTVLDAVLTKKGREILSDKGQEFTVTHFAVSDDEVDYGLWNVAHPEGTDSYGKIIENLPLLEPTTDLQTVMKYKLVTRSTQPTKGCLLEVTPVNEGTRYVLFDHTQAGNGNQTGNSISVTTKNAEDVIGVGQESYTVTLLDASVLGIAVANEENQEEESLYNSITQTSQTLTLPAGVDLALNVKAFNAPSSSDESASQPNITAGYKVYGNSPQTTIIITANMSGATKALNFVVASRIS